MDKRNYRESLEKDRQEINAESTSVPSRRAHRQSGNQKPQQRKNLLLPALFFIFILIPVTILIYVAFIYEPDDTLIGAENDNEVSFENVPPPEESAVIVPEETEEDVAEETDEELSGETDAKTDEKPEETVKEEADEAPAESEKPAEQAAPAEETPAVQAPEEPAESPAAETKTVIVQQNETLYRIAVNNYGASGAGAAVEKIKQANGLSSNEIHVGQKLILP
ncbi:MAG TPA: LysM peptidoglycan-binding domain-containing protein [Planococcus sp. (in: firmicutes)]|nr:LysM peptidoglycan-binding domain-containing protein [Planococcus sp. (in: firmicutes)]